MDKSQTVSLSPLTRSRGNRQVLDGKEVVVGFNRSEWAERCATRFNDIYHYRLFREEEYYKIRKNSMSGKATTGCRQKLSAR